MEKRKRILSREAPRDEFSNRHFVSPDSTRRAVNSPQLCSRSSHGFHVDGDGMQSVEVVHKSDSGPGGHGTTTSNATDNTSHVAKIVHTPVDNTSNDGPAMLESRVTLDRNGRAKKGAISECKFERNNNLLGTFHEDHSSKSVPTVHVRDHHGSGHKPNSSVCKQPATRATNEHRDSSGDGSPYSRRPRRRIWHALNQERSHHLSISGNSRRPPQLIGSNESLKALERRKSTAVQRQPNNYGKSVRDSEGVSTSPRCIDNVMVQEFYEQVPFLKSYSILCPKRSSKLAKTDDYHIPLHAIIVHVLKFSRGAAIYLPAGPSGHIIFSNYDVVFSNCMEGGVYSFVIFLLGCYFVTFKVLCMRSQRLRAPSEPRQERDRSPKRNRAPTPIQTSSVQDHSKRQSLSCPPVRPPLPPLSTQPAPQVSARPPPIPPTPVPARRKVRPSGRALPPRVPVGGEPR